MKDIRKASGCDIVRTFEGKEWTFHRLTIGDYALLSEYYYKERLDQLKLQKDILDKEEFNFRAKNLDQILSADVNFWVLYYPAGYARCLWLANGKKEVELPRSKELDDVVLLCLGIDPETFYKELEKQPEEKKEEPKGPPPF